MEQVQCPWRCHDRSAIRKTREGGEDKGVGGRGRNLDKSQVRIKTARTTLCDARASLWDLSEASGVRDQVSLFSLVQYTCADFLTHECHMAYRLMGNPSKLWLAKECNSFLHANDSYSIGNGCGFHVERFEVERYDGESVGGRGLWQYCNSDASG